MTTDRAPLELVLRDAWILELERRNTMRNGQVPFATKTDEQRIVDRLMCDGYSKKEIEGGFALQAKENGDFTVDSVRKFAQKFIQSDKTGGRFTL